MSYFFCLSCILYVFFFKQKTAYEMRISDWSSDVCSSDLPLHTAARHHRLGPPGAARRLEGDRQSVRRERPDRRPAGDQAGFRADPRRQGGSQRQCLGRRAARDDAARACREGKPRALRGNLRWRRTEEETYEIQSLK